MIHRLMRYLFRACHNCHENGSGGFRALYYVCYSNNNYYCPGEDKLKLYAMIGKTTFKDITVPKNMIIENT